MNLKGQYDYRVRTYECNSEGVATLPAICNYLQESASLHAEELKFSKSNFSADGEDISWVLTRLRVKISRYPKWGETVTVQTFPRGARKITAYRDFAIFCGEEKIGVAASEWMVINLTTRKIVAVPEAVEACINRQEAAVIEEPVFSRLKWQNDGLSSSVKLRSLKSHIDLNGHVNNVRYIEWLIEVMPEGVEKISDFEVVFKSEVMAGEEIVAESRDVGAGIYSARVASLDGKDHVLARICLPEVGGCE